MKKIKAVLITRSEPRHTYFANFLSKHVDLLSVFVHESKRKKISLRSAWKRIISLLSRRSTKEARHFFKKSKVEHAIADKVFCVSDINDESFVDKLLSTEPEMIFTFGCGVIKNEKYFSSKLDIVNLHSGLIPDYRGVDSVYWCIYNKEFEKIGFTIHVIDKRLDMGKIIASDTLKEKIGCCESKVFFDVISAAISKYPGIIQDFSSGRKLSLSIPHENNKIYYEKDRSVLTDLVVCRNLLFKKLKEFIVEKN